jgi:hypothetical protein
MLADELGELGKVALLEERLTAFFRLGELAVEVRWSSTVEDSTWNVGSWAMVRGSDFEEEEEASYRMSSASSDETGLKILER